MRMHRVYISWTFIVNIYNAALVNTTHGFYWRWDEINYDGGCILEAPDYLCFFYNFQ
jgi:hypothetical protein